MNIKCKIIITIDGKDIELTREEAAGLRDSLTENLGEKRSLGPIFPYTPPSYTPPNYGTPYVPEHLRDVTWC